MSSIFENKEEKNKDLKTTIQGITIETKTLEETAKTAIGLTQGIALTPKQDDTNRGPSTPNK